MSKTRFSNFIKTLYKRRSIILLVLLFLFSITIPFISVQVSLSTPIIHQQNNILHLLEQAKKHYNSREFEDAVNIWREVVNNFARQEDKINQAMALSNLSLTYQQLGQWNEAKKAIDQSILFLETSAKTPVQQRILAATLEIEGKLKLAVGQAENALNSWQESQNIYQKIGDNNRVIQTQINQSEALQQLGFYPRSCRTLLEVLNIDNKDCTIWEEELENIPDILSIEQQILALKSLGNVLRLTGKPKQSQTVLLKSLQLANTTKDQEKLAEVSLNLGNTARILGNQSITKNTLSQELIPSFTCTPSGNYQTSQQFYQQAIACYHQAELSSLSQTKIQAQLNLLSLLIQLQQWTKIPTLVDNIQSELMGLPSSQKSVAAHLKLAQNLICLKSIFVPHKNPLFSPILQSCPEIPTTNNGQQPTATAIIDSLQLPSLPIIKTLVETALNQAQSLGDSASQANALGYLGAISGLMGNLTQGQQFTELALQQLSVFDNPELAYFWQWQLARLYQNQGQNQQAIASSTLAVDILDSLRRDLVVSSTDIQFDFRDSVEPLYRELVEQLLQPDFNQSGEISQNNLNKARDVLESLQLAALNNFFREACIDAQPQQIDNLDPQGAVIYAIILSQRLAVILSLPGKPLRYYETVLNSRVDNSPSQQIEEVYDDLLANLNPFIYNPQPLRPHQQFYDWLIRPLERELEENGIKNLVFVLDGILSIVPMATLHDGQQYLIEKYNLALTPGLELLSPRSLSSEQLRILAGGLVEGRQGFSPLPGVEAEVKELSEIVPAEILLNQEFTRSRLQKEIESNAFPIVHLATHGQFSSQVEETFLLTWDERINVKNLDQLLQQRQRQQGSPLELLILSACQTAAGDKRAVLGLAGVAVRSGASSTLATLWSVQDQSTSGLIAQFYQNLSKPGVTKIEALRQAQLSLLYSAEYQHPFYWAPFVLVGNWF